MNGLIAVEYYSAIGKEWKLAICDNMDGFRGYYVKWNKSVRKRQVLYVITCSESKIYDKLVNITKNRLTNIEN